jgi:hypothetical protein
MVADELSSDGRLAISDWLKETDGTVPHRSA